MRSDWLRLMLLAVFGGVYADTDACPLKPVDSTADDWAKWWGRKLQICSWTLASVPGHPVWMDMVHTSAARIRALARVGEDGKPVWPQGYDMTNKIIEVSGPAVVTDVAFAYMSRFGKTGQEELHGLQEPRLFGDALLLPITGFSPGRGIMGSKPTSDPLAYVEHMFAGTWKNPY
ncbi:hypothetical protein BCR44DRAFT_1431169 [Catenaria anguillulae PL171]|uniref:Nucleotide-diphospho-sugar transferase n=1 Tax=Catenaria anguillulae PL171 TaxID=765915 RepID=A0A1Y2HT35_9FUNG|nr:hypothetical protein BCR44DRAFT_1431169 [Catenaria anguillulae PL171]